MDRDFLTNTSLWPNMDMGRYCCLKRGKEAAFILTADNPHGMSGSVVVSLGNVFDGGTGETVQYDSVDHIINDGWIVD